jgi:hypothetical protein
MRFLVISCGQSLPSFAYLLKDTVLTHKTAHLEQVFGKTSMNSMEVDILRTQRYPWTTPQEVRDLEGWS